MWLQYTQLAARVYVRSLFLAKRDNNNKAVEIMAS